MDFWERFEAFVSNRVFEITEILPPLFISTQQQNRVKPYLVMETGNALFTKRRYLGENQKFLSSLKRLIVMNIFICFNWQLNVIQD